MGNQCCRVSPPQDEDDNTSCTGVVVRFTTKVEKSTIKSLRRVALPPQAAAQHHQPSNNNNNNNYTGSSIAIHPLLPPPPPPSPRHNPSEEEEVEADSQQRHLEERTLIIMDDEEEDHHGDAAPQAAAARESFNSDGVAPQLPRFFFDDGICDDTIHHHPRVVQYQHPSPCAAVNHDGTIPTTNTCGKAADDITQNDYPCLLQDSLVFSNQQQQVQGGLSSLSRTSLAASYGGRKMSLGSGGSGHCPRSYSSSSGGGCPDPPVAPSRMSSWSTSSVSSLSHHHGLPLAKVLFGSAAALGGGMGRIPDAFSV